MQGGFPETRHDTRKKDHHLITLIGCNTKAKNGSANSLLVKTGDSSKIANQTRDTVYGGEAINNGRLLSSSDTSDDTPTPAEERRRLLETYNEIRIIDTTIIESNNDSLHFYLRYHCLKDDKIIVPSRYASDEKHPQDYIAYGFASDILLILNHDTVLNTQFKASTFNPFFQDNFGGNLKKYGSILMPELLTSNKDPYLIVLHYSIAIPATDIGKGVFVIISDHGKYRVSENYQ